MVHVTLLPYEPEGASRHLTGVSCDVLRDRPMAGAFTSFGLVNHHKREFPHPPARGRQVVNRAFNQSPLL